jgi:hypothetical protein
MGIRFKSSSWRAPLRLIDSLLAPHQPSNAIALAGREPFRLVEAFARAGWLKGAPAAPLHSTSMAHGSTSSIQPCSVRVVRSGSTGTSQKRDMRLVISGRIGDVCAELDRLAAQEQAAFVRRL